MSCKCAIATDEYHGWECEITGGECMFLNPNSKVCAEKYGEGPTGYTAINLKGVKDIAKLTDECIEAQVAIAAKICKVSKALVKLISKEEYDSQTEEDDDFDDD